MGISGAEQHILQTHFGAFLKMCRDQWGVRQREVLLYLPGWTQASYSRLESGAIAPAFDQLLPIYTALQQAGVSWSAADRQHYLVLARARIEEKKRQSERHEEPEWADLRYQLANVDFLLDEPEDVPDRWSPPKPLQAETRHLLGREDWLADLTRVIQTASPKKLVVLHGPVGIGKSSELHRLMQHFISASDPAYHVIWIPLLPAERSAGPESGLTLMLGNMLAESGAPPPTPEMASWEKQQRLLFAYLEQGPRPVVILVDNAENALLADGSLAPCWEEFLAHWLRRQHRATLVMATKEWPGWPGRERGLVYESKVPPLDLPTSIVLLQQQGLETVPLADLQEVWQRVGGIPLYLEWVASLAQHPHQLNQWQSFDLVEGPDDAPATGEQAAQAISQRLTRLLGESALLRGHLAGKLRPLLARIIEKRLSSEARALLETLAVCNVPLGKTALQSLCEHPGLINELRNASLLVPYAHRVQVLPVVADVVTQELAEERVSELEQQVIAGLRKWVDEGSIAMQEAGAVITELAVLLLKHHRLLETAELLIRYGWLSINQELIPRIIKLVTNILKQPDWQNTKENACGGLLLHIFLRRYLKLENSNVEGAFQHVFQIARNKDVVLNPGTILYLLGNELRLHLMKDQYEDAWKLINSHYLHYESLRESDLIVFIEFLERRAYVLGRWGDAKDAEGLKEEATYLRQACVDENLECLALLGQCESSASPLQMSYILFKRARHLNDIACYQHSLGHFEEERQALKECLDIKERGLTLPGSLAVSYGNYSQLLGELGLFQEALIYSNRALQIVQKMLDAGLSSFSKEKGMHLIDRGKLLLLLGCLDEAKACFEEGLSLVEGTSRRYSVASAKSGLQLIERQYQENPHRYLDWQWFPRYLQLASYSDVSWLAQAGPFTDEEQQEWDALFHQNGNEAASKRLAALIVTSRKRELDVSLREQREPCFHYPRIPHDEVHSKIVGFTQLRTDIEQNEPNVIVRCLYVAAIDELLNELLMIAAVGRQDDESFWTFNQRLNPTPTIPEMQIAVRDIGRLLKKGLKLDNTKDLAKQLIQQVSQWAIDPMNIPYTQEEREQEALRNREGPPLIIDDPQRLFSPETVRRFFVDVFQRYQFPWAIELDPATNHAHVSQSLKQLILPADKRMSSEKIRQLLGHEIETHVFRAVSGEKSTLALLSIGLAGYLETEEGLAIYYTQKVDKYTGSTKAEKSWIGTLATGLAAGVISKPYTFQELRLFLESVNILQGLLTENDSPLTQIREEARRNAQNRCLRTWRGVTDLTKRSICSTKDNVYLRGYLAVCEVLEKDSAMFQRLMAGSVGLQHLPDLAELGIVTPHVKHLQLATDPDLDVYIARFDE